MATSDDKATPTAHPASAEALHSARSPDQPAKEPPRGLSPPEIIRHWTAEERERHEKKLLRKMDIRILPMIVIMYILNYIDR